jgi:protein-S-isoprenylcysteine O-methyltransferase Ste14
MAFHHHDKDEPDPGDTSDGHVEGSVTEDDEQSHGMIPARRHRRSWFERISMRILATGGIIGVDVALGAILTANHVHGWIVGLVVGLVSVVLAAILWSSRQL